MGAIINEVLYKEYLDEELNWRKKASKKDVVLVDELISNVNKIEPEIKYLFEITVRNNHVREVNDLLASTIYKLEDRGQAAMIVGALGSRKNKAYTAVVIDSYERLPESILKEGTHLSLFYDNALAQMSDKRYIDKYLEWVKKWYHVGNLPFLLNKICSWGIEEAKEMLIEHLFLNEECEIYEPHVLWKPRNQSYVNAICALSNFKTKDIRIIDAIVEFRNLSQIPNIIKCAENNIKKLYKKWK